MGVARHDQCVRCIRNNGNVSALPLGISATADLLHKFLLSFPGKPSLLNIASINYLIVHIILYMYSVVI